MPEIASRRHCEFISAAVAKALTDAGKTLDEVDAIAVTFARADRRSAGGSQLCKGAGLRCGQSRWCWYHLRDTLPL